jgi:hypothetical protein
MDPWLVPPDGAGHEWAALRGFPVCCDVAVIGMLTPVTSTNAAASVSTRNRACTREYGVVCVACSAARRPRPVSDRTKEESYSVLVGTCERRIRGCLNIRRRGFSQQAVPRESGCGCGAYVSRVAKRVEQEDPSAWTRRSTPYFPGSGGSRSVSRQTPGAPRKISVSFFAQSRRERDPRLGSQGTRGRPLGRRPHAGPASRPVCGRDRRL